MDALEREGADVFERRDRQRRQPVGKILQHLPRYDQRYILTTDVLHKLSQRQHVALCEEPREEGLVLFDA